jgi:NADH dehydrogenase
VLSLHGLDDLHDSVDLARGDRSAAVFGLNTGTADVVAVPLDYQSAEAGVQPLRVANSVEIDSVVPGTVRYGQQLTLYGTGLGRVSRVLLGEVTDIDLASRTVTSTVLDQTRVTAYDTLVVAAGAGQSYFGNDQFARFAPGMKSIDDALELRGRIFGSFELAEVVEDEEQRTRLMTFVVVGGGPTGTEMAGALADMVHFSMEVEYPDLAVKYAHVYLVDHGNLLLAPFSEKAHAYAAQALRRKGVDIRLGISVKEVAPDHVLLSDGTSIQTRTVVWAGGLMASPLAANSRLPRGHGPRRYPE